VSAGANVKAVQKMLGHASAAMTLDIYADLFDDDLEAVATALHDARLRESVGKMWARDGEPTNRSTSQPASRLDYRPLTFEFTPRCWSGWREIPAAAGPLN
jgi:hypothetical protein